MPAGDAERGTRRSRQAALPSCANAHNHAKPASTRASSCNARRALIFALAPRNARRPAPLRIRRKGRSYRRRTIERRQPLANRNNKMDIVSTVSNASSFRAAYTYNAPGWEPECGVMPHTCRRANSPFNQCTKCAKTKGKFTPLLGQKSAN